MAADSNIWEPQRYHLIGAKAEAELSGLEAKLAGASVMKLTHSRAVAFSESDLIDARARLENDH